MFFTNPFLYLKKKEIEREKKNMYRSGLADLTLNYIIFKNYISHKKHCVKKNIEYIAIFYSLK